MEFHDSDNFDHYFDHDADIGIIGRGDTVEAAFVDAAKAMFAIMVDNIEQVKPKQSIEITFIEGDTELAFVEWLNALIAEARSQGIVLSHFELQRQGDQWRGEAWGEPWGEQMQRGTEVKGATLTMLSVKPLNSGWEARCVVDV